MRPQDVISCSPSLLYDRDVYRDELYTPDDLIAGWEAHRAGIEVIAEVYPGTDIRRPPPKALGGDDSEFLSGMTRAFDEAGSKYARCPPSFLVVIKDAVIWDNMLFAVIDGTPTPVYEFYRPLDRPAKGLDVVSRLLSSETSSLDMPCPLFIGSAGSFNYGHWLVDDLPALACARQPTRADPISNVIMTAYGSAIDRVRVEGTSLALGRRAAPRIDLVSADIAYRVRNLRYVTPFTYHPIFKNPRAVGFVREICDACLFNAPSLAGTDRIFVGRNGAHFRRLLNEPQIVDRLRSAGYSLFEPEKHSFGEQCATFSNATHVVGTMGAGMATSLLCDAGAKVLHLAPNGWTEYFFWDLAAMSGHDFAALFGAPDDTSPHAFRNNFSVEPSALDGILSRL